jgi:cell fate regulator YaaT (PSP1 superfamily)
MVSEEEQKPEPENPELPEQSAEEVPPMPELPPDTADEPSPTDASPALPSTPSAEEVPPVPELPPETADEPSPVAESPAPPSTPAEGEPAVAESTPAEVAETKPEAAPPPDIVAYIRLGGEWEVLPHDPAGLEFNAGETVIIELDDGVYFGTVVEPGCPLLPGAIPEKIPKVLRRASVADLEKIEGNWEFERKAGANFKEVTQKAGLEMKLVGVRALLDASRVTFFYTAEDRVDFREVVRELARIYHTRIEMWQIGVRDEARRLGGIGICGRELCCVTFLREFLPVTMKMAKEQGLALAPTKISGCCGRLMCCLAYENEWYGLARESFPKIGESVTWEGRRMRVHNIHLLTSEISLASDEDNVLVRVKLTDLIPPEEPSAEEA